jgi:hypothetical protein
MRKLPFHLQEISACICRSARGTRQSFSSTRHDFVLCFESKEDAEKGVRALVEGVWKVRPDIKASRFFDDAGCNATSSQEMPVRMWPC